MFIILLGPVKNYLNLQNLLQNKTPTSTTLTTTRQTRSAHSEKRWIYLLHLTVPQTGRCEGVHTEVNCHILAGEVPSGAGGRTHFRSKVVWGGCLLCFVRPISYRYFYTATRS